MSKPARFHRKSKPEAMLARRRLAIVLLAIQATEDDQRRSRRATWKAIAADLRIVEERGVAAPVDAGPRHVSPSAICDRSLPPGAMPGGRAGRRARPARATADQRIGGAYWMPPLDQSAFRPRAICELRAGADVALEDLAVVADRLDRRWRPSRWRGRCPRRRCRRRRAGGGFPGSRWSSSRRHWPGSTPSSSALSSAKCVHLTMLNHWSSPWRTTGPSGSLEMISGRTM